MSRSTSVESYTDCVFLFLSNWQTRSHFSRVVVHFCNLTIIIILHDTWEVHFLVNGCPIALAPFVGHIIFPSSYCFCNFAKYQSNIFLHSVFCSTDRCVSPQPKHTVLIPVATNKFWNWIDSFFPLFFAFKIAFAILVPLPFQINFTIVYIYKKFLLVFW